MTQQVNIGGPPKRGRGRPKGSKNRPKASASRENDSGRRSSPAPAPVDSPLLGDYQTTARKLQAAIDVESDPKILASLSSSLNQILKQVGKLTGEGDITEAQIVRSRAWRSFLSKIEDILERHPDCAAELHERLAVLA